MMEDSDMIKRVYAFAAECHRGQVDKAGCKYIEHPKRVADRCEHFDEKIAALLHDTMEDCGVTPDMLRELGLSEEIIDAVQACTKKKHEDYFDFVRRAGKNRIARAVKMHDLEDNMDIVRLVSLCPESMDVSEQTLRSGGCCVLNDKDLYRLNKYLMAYRVLLQMG